MMDLIVFLSVAFAAVFTLAWLLSPKLRAWIERPKYGFANNVKLYDQAQEGRRRQV